MLLAMANASKAFGYAACGQCGASGEGVGSPAQRVLQGVSMEHRLRKLGRVCDNCLRGWTAYHGISQYDSPVPELDDWIRRRVRMLLSETVALGTHEGSALGGFGRELEDGNRACCQQQKPLAHGKSPGGAAGTVQRVVESARFGQRKRPVAQGTGCHDLKLELRKRFVERADLLNRPLRTRTVGGVGAGS